MSHIWPQLFMYHSSQMGAALFTTTFTMFLRTIEQKCRYGDVAVRFWPYEISLTYTFHLFSLEFSCSIHTRLQRWSACSSKNSKWWGLQSFSFYLCSKFVSFIHKYHIWIWLGQQSEQNLWTWFFQGTMVLFHFERYLDINFSNALILVLESFD